MENQHGRFLKSCTLSSRIGNNWRVISRRFSRKCSGQAPNIDLSRRAGTLLSNQGLALLVALGVAARLSAICCSQFLFLSFIFLHVFFNVHPSIIISIFNRSCYIILVINLDVGKILFIIPDEKN